MTTATTSPSQIPFGVVRFLWGVAADIAIVVITILTCIVVILSIVVTRQTRSTDLLGPPWCRWILRICGIRVEVEGLHNLDPARSYVIISNHLSNFDVWATLGSVPRKLRFVAKKELTRLPIFGRALAMSDHVVIDRSNPEQAVQRINERVARQGNEPFCVLFYAEGTRSRDGKIQAFKKGGVSLAIHTGLPVVPMTVCGTRKFLPKNSWVIRPGGRVKIIIDQPIETKGLAIEQRDDLNEQVRRVVVSNYIEDY